MHSPYSTTILSDLRASLSGRAVGPGDDEYDSLRLLFSGEFDPRPAILVRPANAVDVSRTVRFARESGLELAVRGGGHSGAGHSTSDGGIVLDLRDMTGLEIDAGARTAWAEAGLTAGQYSAAAAGHGLATGFGDTGSVGIGGITLGGGIGYLSRKYGLTIDSLLAAEIVTADGEVLRAGEKEHPDLFWAIRGGGGNFGVATRFKFRLHPVDRIAGGILVLPATADVIAGFIAAAEAAPEELSAIVNVMPAPPMPFVPAEHHGKLIVLAMMCYAGDPDAGERVLAPFRALAAPIADMLRPMTYPEMFPPEDESYRPTAASRTLFMKSVGRGTAEMMLEHLRASDAAVRVVQLRVLGGAIARVPADATAYAHRARPILAVVASFYNGVEDRAVRAAWVSDLARALDQGEPGAYVNFLARDDDGARVRAAYPGGTWDRLARVKAKYDPANFFRRNFNVTPEAAV